MTNIYTTAFFSFLRQFSLGVAVRGGLFLLP